MKKILVSVAFVALTSGSAFAGEGGMGGMGGIGGTGGAITVNAGGSFTPGAVNFGGVFNAAGQTLNTTVTNNSPARAGAAAAATGNGNGGSAVAISGASTVNSQYVSPTNYISFSNTLRQSLNY